MQILSNGHLLRRERVLGIGPVVGRHGRLPLVVGGWHLGGFGAVTTAPPEGEEGYAEAEDGESDADANACCGAGGETF